MAAGVEGNGANYFKMQLFLGFYFRNEKKDVFLPH